MAFSIPFSEMSSEDKALIRREYTVRKFVEPGWESRTCFIRSKITGEVYLPLGKWDLFYEDFPHIYKKYPRTKVEFTAKLFTLETDPRGFRDQDVVTKEAITNLSTFHSCFLWISTGYGKTICAIYLMAWAKMKTVVLAFNRIIRQQWKERIESFSNATVQYLKSSKEKLDPKADVYLIGLEMASKMDRSVFEDIGMVIVDEAHLSTEKGFCESLLKFEPCYLIGATATPKRSDNLHKIYEFYFGPFKRFIFREERNKGHTVIKYCTHYRPEIGYITYRGKTGLNWSKMKNSLAYNPERQREIVNIIQKHSEEKVIVLTDRQEEAKAIHKLLGPEEAELLIGRKQKHDKTKRVLVAGMKKGGVGLDDPELTMLVLITSGRNVEQFEGRLRNNNCLIYDFVDDHRSLEQHWKSRKRWYNRRGATIKEGGPRGTGKIINKNRASSTRFLEKNLD